MVRRIGTKSAFTKILSPKMIMEVGEVVEIIKENENKIYKVDINTDNRQYFIKRASILNPFPNNNNVNVSFPIQKKDRVLIAFYEGNIENAIIIGYVHTDNSKYNPLQKQIEINFFGNNLIFDKDGIKFNNGSKSVARVDDKTRSDSTEDPTFWAWIVAVDTFCRAVSSALGIPFAVTMPTALDSKIIEGNDKVKL